MSPTAQPVVICMAADPEPHKAVDGLDCKRPVVASNPGGPEATDFLEMKSRMMRILFQVRMRPIGEPLDLWWQGSITGPEIGGCVVSQRGLVFPAAWSRRALSANWSSLPT
jgi:hypothetical protein